MLLSVPYTRLNFVFKATELTKVLCGNRSRGTNYFKCQLTSVGIEGSKLQTEMHDGNEGLRSLWLGQMQVWKERGTASLPLEWVQYPLPKFAADG